MQATADTAKVAERALKEKLAGRSELRPASSTGRLTPDSPFGDLVAYWLQDIDLEGRISKTTRILYVVLGVETDLFFGKPVDVKSEYFVAISRAKDDLVITSADFRTKPDGASWRWSEERTLYEELIYYALEA